MPAGYNSKNIYCTYDDVYPAICFILQYPGQYNHGTIAVSINIAPANKPPGGIGDPSIILRIGEVGSIKERISA